MLKITIENRETHEIRPVTFDPSCAHPHPDWMLDQVGAYDEPSFQAELSSRLRGYHHYGYRDGERDAEGLLIERS
jgi:hypothetical protein